MSSDRGGFSPGGRFGLVGGAVGVLAMALTMFGRDVPRVPKGALTAAGITGFQTTQGLRVSVNLRNAGPGPLEGTLRGEVFDADGQAVARAERPVRQTEQAAAHALEMPAVKGSPDRLTLVCRLGDERVEVPLGRVLVVKAHETALAASQEYVAGSTAALRCDVHGVKSVSETVPLAGAAVEVALRAAGRTLPLYAGTTGADGRAKAEFRVPDVPAGQYTLVVTTQSALGQEKLERAVQVKNGAKVLLVSDKPLYQPGQVMHLRALALRPSDLRPVAGADLVFEVEDAKGNKVFKRTHRTSEFGVAAVDFQLADEVNMGAYHVRAQLGDQQADKAVRVERYVLPKFKVAVSADKSFYLPKETVHAEVQADYFFGKPVAGAKVRVTASTFDVQFREFQTWEGKTDAAGHAKLDIQLPAYFVGQPLQKGDAFVRLEAKVTDTADHAETVGRQYTVSEQPIRLSLIPEGGRLAAGMENRIFAAAIYPDGSPAPCTVRVWAGREAKGEPLATVRTSAAGLAEFRLTPKAGQFRAGAWEQRPVEMLGGTAPHAWGQRQLLDLVAEARDAKGNAGRATAELNADPFGENVILRLDKAVYRAGDAVRIDLRSSAGLPTAYLDVVRGGQTLLTRWLDVKDGKADYRLDLPAEVFGTLEVHAYQVLAGGEIVRDSRVIYVQPRSDLKIAVQTDKDVHRPGEAGRIRFEVTGADGKPAVAALGVIVVDESVYALQEMQPGLEKVYFTLQQELLKPQVQVGYRPAEPLDRLVREPELAADRQQVAEVLLTAAKPAPPARWEVAPAAERRRRMEGQVQQVGWALTNYALNSGKDVMVYDRQAKRWRFKSGLLADVTKEGYLAPAALDDPLGSKLTLEVLGRLESRFTAEHLARAVTQLRMQQLAWQLVNVANANRARWYRDGQWKLPATLVGDAIREPGLNEAWLKDAWGRRLRLVRRDQKLENPTGWDLFDHHELVSAGPDGKFDTADDVRQTGPDRWRMGAWWADGVDVFYTRTATRLGVANGFGGRQHFGMAWGGGGGVGGGMLMERAMAPAGMAAGGMPPAPVALYALRKAGDAGEVDKRGGAGSGPAPARVREYFPETMLWQPALITDERGIAELPVTFPDSITTWRLTASASSRGGALGGVTAPLRVFQDFFVDLDLPVSLTQNDEVAFPVAVYNYLPAPQTVRLELERGEWFELADKAGPVRSLDLKPNEVAAVKFRIRARRIGTHPLTVRAAGTNTADAVRRSIEVVPDGRKVEQAFTDRLTGRVAQVIDIPADAVPGASRIFVKLYPGVFSQLLEGAEGILRMPGGCFEQTSSSAYPNVLAVDYMVKSRMASAEQRLKAEAYLNVGYQRLLTFERPGGGFDWWGSGEPLVWLSAYGLQEFSDMARVYPIDRGVITRTQQWLLRQQAADGTWSNIGATHNETIAQMGDPSLLLTSYVAWSLLDSGLRGPQLDKAIAYVRGHVADARDNAYILALAANALAAYDPKDDSTLDLITKLEKLRQDVPQWQASCFPANGQSLTYARGDSVTVETTALAALAMIRTGQFPNRVSQALTYLVKSKDPHGTWGSTSATVLSLKALVAGLGGVKQKGKAGFVVRVNGKEAARGEVAEENADVMQAFDLKEHTRPGRNDVEIEVAGETNLLYQVVGRHFEPWAKQPPPAKPALEVAVEYDRKSLTTADLLRAKAILRYHGPTPTYNVIVDLGIPPGFAADAGDFAEMVGRKRVQKFSLTSRQATLYLGDVKPGDVLTFEYGLKPKYPIKAKTPATVAYEYYTPANRAEARPVELEVTGR